MFTDSYLPQDSRTSMDGKDPADSNSLQPWDLPPTTQSFTAPESAEGGNGAPFPPQASPNFNGLPPCDPNLPAPSSCELKSDQNQPAADHQQPWDIPLTTGTFSAPEPAGEEAVVNDDRVTTTGNSTSTNGVHATAGNIAHKNKPEDITIVEAESDPAGTISSPASQVLSPHRNYGTAQPTEILLGMPQEADQDIPIKSGSHEVKVSQEEQEAVASDDKVTTTDSSASTNGIHGNITHKKNKPEDITIVEAESDPAGSISSPASQVHSPRNYGNFQPTEILLAMPQETDQDLPGSRPSFEAKTSQDEPVAVEVMCHEPSSSTPLSPPPDYNTLELPPSYISDIPEVLDEQVRDDNGNSHTEQVDHDQLVAGSNTETGEKEQLQGQEVTTSNGDNSTAVLESEVTPEVEVKSQLTENQEKAREAIVNDIRREFEEASTKDEDEVYKDSCCGGCIGCCFQGVSCTPSNPCINRRSSPVSVSKKKQLLNTAALTKGRRRGWDHFKEAIFPLVPDFLRVLWVFIELILVLVGLLFSITTLSLDQNEAFNIIHLVLAIISCILAMIDAYETFRHSKILKKICCKKRTAEDINEEDGEDGDCKKCYSRCTDLFDVMRVILSELIFYPLLICDVFEVITGRGFEGDSSGDRLGIALFVISLISMVLTVYVARIVVLVGVVINASAVRTLPKDIADKDRQESGYDQVIKNSAVYYQSFFCVYVILQMLTQVLMYIAIAAKIRYDNRHFYQDENTDERIFFTSYAGYMIVAGYLLPFLGLFNFFIVTFYWSQQYPIGFRLDMLSISKMTNYSITDLLNPKKMVKEKVDSLNEKASTEDSSKTEKFVAEFSKAFVPLKNDFKELFEKGFFEKFSYPFNSPALVIICFLYTVLQLAFILCAAQTMDEMGVVINHVLNGGGWVVYYIVVIIVGVIANCYVFLVAGFWILTISAIIVISAIILAVAAIWITCCVCNFIENE